MVVNFRAGESTCGQEDSQFDWSGGRPRDREQFGRSSDALRLGGSLLDPHPQLQHSLVCHSPLICFISVCMFNGE